MINQAMQQTANNQIQNFIIYRPCTTPLLGMAVHLPCTSILDCFHFPSTSQKNSYLTLCL